MANKTLLGLVGGVGVAVGVALVVLQPKAPPPVDHTSFARDLDASIAAVAGSVRERTNTIAAMHTLQNSLSTDAATVRDQTQGELALRPGPGEIITLGQVPTDGAPPAAILVLPASADAASDLEHNGTRVVIAGDRALVVDVATVMPSDAARAKVIHGAVAVSRPLDLTPLASKLDAADAALRLREGDHVLSLGRHRADTGDVTHALALSGETGHALSVELIAPPLARPMGFMRPVGVAVALLSLLVAGLSLRGNSFESAPTAAGGPVTTAPNSNAGASEIGVGSIIQDTYEVTQLLGQGGMGAVWEARHLRLPDKRVAVKMLVGEHVQEELFARFRREAEITSKLGHPNIVGVLDFNTLPSGAPYIVLELLEGESLGKRLERGKLPVDQALRIAQQIGSALNAAHRAEIVHRDLKPDNVFLVRAASDEHREQAKVLDFGISKMRGNLTTKTQDATMLGTPQYMSPEQASGRNSEVDARSDVWALGVIVYEMLTGKSAFGAPTLPEVVVKIVVEPAPTLRGRSGIPEHVVAAVDRALTKSPDERFPDVRSFIAALTNAPLMSGAHDVG